MSFYQINKAEYQTVMDLCTNGNHVFELGFKTKLINRAIIYRQRDNQTVDRGSKYLSSSSYIEL